MYGALRKSCPRQTSGTDAIVQEKHDVTTATVYSLNCMTVVPNYSWNIFALHIDQNNKTEIMLDNENQMHRDAKFIEFTSFLCFCF